MNRQGPFEQRLRFFLAATVLIKGTTYPRLPFEILRLGLRDEVGIVLSPLVIHSARRHSSHRFPSQLSLFERLMARLAYEETAEPTPEQIAASRLLCRDESDVPIALAAIAAKVNYLVTTDRDLTVVDTTTTRLRQQVRVITPLALLRHVLKWSETRIEAAIHRHWSELSLTDWEELETKQEKRS